jgi:hypothetical protein
MVIYATPCVDIKFIDEVDFLLIKWKQKPDNQVFREVYTRVLQYAKESYYTTLFCTDLSLIGSLKSEQETWLNSEYYQRVYNCLGVDIYAAIIFSEEHFKAMITNYKPAKTESLHTFIQFNYFTKMNEAFHWLASIKKGQDALV